jgi:NADH:ubiquinone oxidoreductase subunit F (NADH-binding)
VITAIKESGLRGRGGAGFPAGIKWASCADAEGSQKYVVCNADEGNPGAFLNRAQLEGDPFSVLEGMVIAGYATGADRGVIYLRSEYPLARATLERAIDVFLQAGLLGPDVADAGFAFSIELVVGAGAYICGEETALLNSIEGLRPNPRAKTHFPTQRGLYGRPTVINNVETLATVPAVLAIGAEQYARLGTPASHGTKTISLVGSVRRPGLVELEFGASLGTLVNDVGAGTPEGTALLAVHVGGPSGKLMLPDILSSPICYAALNEAGTMLGSGEFFVLSDHDCPLAFAGRYVRFAVDEGCGKCTPCRIGNFRLLEILERLEGGSAHEGDVERMHQLATTIHENAACGLGQTSANPILSVIQNFPDALEKHQNEDGCPLGTPRTAWDHAEVE